MCSVGMFAVLFYGSAVLYMYSYANVSYAPMGFNQINGVCSVWGAQALLAWGGGWVYVCGDQLRWSWYAQQSCAVKLIAGAISLTFN